MIGLGLGCLMWFQRAVPSNFRWPLCPKMNEPMRSTTPNQDNPMSALGESPAVKEKVPQGSVQCISANAVNRWNG